MYLVGSILLANVYIWLASKFMLYQFRNFFVRQFLITSIFENLFNGQWRSNQKCFSRIYFLEIVYFIPVDSCYLSKTTEITLTLAWSFLADLLSKMVIGICKGMTIYVYSEFMGKTFQAAQLTHERFLTIDHSCKIFFWYLPN